MTTNLQTPTVWPVHMSDLTTLLQIQCDSSMRCHGWAKTTQKTCKNKIAQGDASRAIELIQQIVSAGLLYDLVSQDLKDLASLLFCKRYHQTQSASKYEAWLRDLPAVPTSVPPQTPTPRRKKTPVLSVPKIEQNIDTKSTPPTSNRKLSGVERDHVRKIKSEKPEQTIQEALVAPTNTKKHRTRINASSTHHNTTADTSASQETNQEAPSKTQEPVGTGSSDKSTAAEPDDSPVSFHTRSRSSLSSPPRSPPRNNPTEPRSFEPFGTRKSVREINQGIKTKLLAPFLSSETGTAGYIYGFIHPDNNGTVETTENYIKIGQSKNVERRMSSFMSKCHYEPQVLFSCYTVLHVRIEKIVHLQLHNLRKRQHSCPACGVRHQEWFCVNVDLARELVEMWKRWTDAQPYEEQEILKEYWQGRLEKLDLDDINCWEKFVYGW